jgi:ATP-binding cassette subfamily B protein
MNHIFRILRSAGELKRHYYAISALTVVVSLAGLAMPILSGQAIDEIRFGAEANVTKLIWLAVGIFVLDLANTFLNSIVGYLGDQMGVLLNRSLSVKYYSHLLSLPQQYFDTELSGKIINRLSRSITQITNFMQMISNNFLQFILSTVFSLAVIAYYSWQVALLLFLLYPVYIWMTVRTSNTWQKYQATKNEHADIASGRFAEAISQIKVVKSFVQESGELGFFKKHYTKIASVTKPQSRFWHERDVRRRLVLNIIFLVVFIFIFTQAASGQYTPGVAVTLILLAMQIRIPIFTISFLVENTQKAVADSKDYFEIMSVSPQISDIEAAKKLIVSNGRIEIKDMSFRYDKKTPVLSRLNLDIKPDSKIALVGESGEGKTTLTNLILRMYEPTEGSIEIDGQDVSEVTQKSLRESIGVVFQEPALFSGTIAENIGYAVEKPNIKDVKFAAKSANAHDFIMELPEGYDSQIGERGLKLSGGQKQRIAIARALLKDAPILILDEATSSLDSKSESMVQEALERLMKGRTTIIIAHRLSTIQHVDQIVTIKNGKIDEIGSPAKLAKSGGVYSQLLELQTNIGNKNTKKQLQKFEIEG